MDNYKIKLESVRVKIENLIKEEQKIAKDFKKELDIFLQNGNKELALTKVNYVFENHTLFLYHFKQYIEDYK